MASGSATIIRNTVEEELRLRDATVDDLDGITQLAIESFPDDPERDYRFPYRDEFPEDHWKWTRREYQDYFEKPAKFHTMVVEAIRHRTRQPNREASVHVRRVQDLGG